jgi:hypothetical protein
MAFEHLMAEAQIKKEKEHKKKEKKPDHSHWSKKGESGDYPSDTSFKQNWERER